MGQTKIGTIHGRFHPFHLGHLQMARQAFQHCENLIIGLTNPDPEATSSETADPDRHRPEANPFSYWERSFITTTALLRDGIPPESFSIVPFSINEMDSWPWEFYMPREAIWYIRVKSEWGEQKVERLRKYGLNVKRLPFERYSEINGTQIRREMRRGGNWEDDLPEGSVEAIRRFNLLERFS